MATVPTTAGFNPDKVLADFERAWASGGAPALDVFLPPNAAIPRPAFRDLLCDVVPIDLEYRWCAHGPRTPGGAIPARPRVDDYLKVYGMLGPVEQLPADLIAAEYRVRCWSGEPPGHEEYATRFPRQAVALRGLLAQIDGEMAEERARVERFVREAAPPPAEAVAAPVVASAALLEALKKHPLLRPGQLDELVRENAGARFPHAHALAQHLLERDWLTAFQVNSLLQGKAGSLILGPYLLLGRLGEGAMGRSRRGSRPQPRRRAQVFRKELLADLMPRGSRLYQEVQAVGRLSHPHVIHAYDAGPVAPPTFSRWNTWSASTSAGSSSRAVAADRRRAISSARRRGRSTRERGLVHRDLKPSTCWWRCRSRATAAPERRRGGSSRSSISGSPAAAFEGRRSGHGLTLRGDVLSTPDYARSRPTTRTRPTSAPTSTA